ncbi:Signal peptidase complex subunit 3 [Bagarius yarrelli]|uniref:Signal peptidase complex subunit 3 n=1 Tax=Bagarius yarrelli TaxID=175774 RepID=A0A556V6W9_BAGYA|nr:Signal peptidase complex subunit 3 [Bagarius yarrelli]
MAALTFGCFITTAFRDRSVPVNIHVSKVLLKNVDDFTGPREKSDLSFMTFDLSADILCMNQVVLWDKIVKRGENTRLELRDMKSKYYFFDDGNGLRANKNVTLTLSWNVVPNAGILPLVMGSGHITVPFPESYENAKSY